MQKYIGMIGNTSQVKPDFFHINFEQKKRKILG